MFFLKQQKQQQLQQKQTMQIIHPKILINPKQKNMSNELNNYIETNSYLQTDINQQTKENNINKQNLNAINKNKAKKEIKLNNLINPNSKPINIKNKERNKIKSFLSNTLGTAVIKI